MTKRFGETVALNDFSLHVEAGTLFGLLGPNGAGKTTAISVMLNLYPADSGTIRIFGQSMPKDELAIKRRVGIDPQSRNTILENIRELNRRGATIIYTSHYMEEVELLCNRVAIVDEGRIIAEGTQDELKDQVMTLETARIKVEALTPGLLDRLGALERVRRVEYEEPYLDVSLEKDTPLAPLLDVLHDERVRFTAITVDRPSLNTVFLALTGKTLRE